MAFKKKSAPSAKSLDLSMNNQAAAGVSAVNSKGQAVDKAGQVVDWPFSSINLKPGATKSNRTHSDDDASTPHQASNTF